MPGCVGVTQLAIEKLKIVLAQLPVKGRIVAIPFTGGELDVLKFKVYTLNANE
jgi:hypothetical protein